MRVCCCRIMLLFGIVALAGCATSPGRATGQQAGGPPAKTGLLIEPDQARQIGFVPNWATDLSVPASDQISAAKVLGDTLIVIQRPSNFVSAVAVSDGHVRWQQVVGPPGAPLHAPARHNDQILINSDNRLYKFDAHSGDSAGIDNLGTVASTGPSVAGDLAIFGGVDGHLFGHDLNKGFAVWQYQLNGEIVAPPIIVSRNVFAADAHGTYGMFNAQNGRVLWRGRTFDAVTARPAADRSTVYVPSRDRTLYALNRTTGRDQWKFRAAQPLTLAPYVFEQMVLMPLRGKGVLALDSLTGQQLWSLPVTATPLERKQDRLVLATDRQIMLVDPKAGRVAARGKTRRLSTILEGPDGSLILLSPRGQLLRINPAK